ncbi:MAG: alcohol dehydrogenase catalytic domain-containing protein, partial [Pseudomonadota bacterium]
MTVPTTMQAMVLTGHGDLDVYEWHEDWPVPELGQTEVLIKVGACGLNNTDVNTRSGWYSKTVTAATTGSAYETVSEEDPTWGGAPITFPRIQGADAVGIVVAAGPDADPSLIGKRVLVDGWQRDWSDPDNKNKARYFGSEVDGGFAQFTKADHRGVQPIVSDLSDAELATFSCSYTTAEGMLTRAQVSSDDTV